MLETLGSALERRRESDEPAARARGESLSYKQLYHKVITCTAPKSALIAYVWRDDPFNLLSAYACAAAHGFCLAVINANNSNDAVKSQLEVVSAHTQSVAFELDEDSSKFGGSFKKTSLWGGEELNKEFKGSLQSEWVALFTSGTSSSLPKAVVRTQGSAVEGYATHVSAMRWREDLEVFHCVWPLTGISSFFFSTMTLYFGGVVEFSGGGEMTWDRLRNATFTTFGPMHLERLLASPPSSVALRSVMCSGALTPLALKLRTLKALKNTDCVYLEAYGSTEAGIMSLLTPALYETNGSVDEFKLSTVGREPPFSGNIEFTNEGEIVASGCMMACAYLKFEGRIAITKLFTGDFGARQANGLIKLFGRRDDRLEFKDGTFAYPAQILSELDARDLSKIAVVGTTGGRFSIYHEGDQVVEFKKGADSRFSRHLDGVIAVDALPRTSTGKIIVSELGRVKRLKRG